MSEVAAELEELEEGAGGSGDTGEGEEPAEEEEPAEAGDGLEEPAEPAEGEEPGEELEQALAAGEVAIGDVGDEEARRAELERQVATERELEQRAAKLERENERHARRVIEIVAEGAEDLIPCPVCMDGIAGWVYIPEVQALAPEAVARVRTIIGLPDLTTYLQDPDTETCPTCGGRGETKTGGNVPGYETRTCPTCKKQGYVVINRTTGELEAVPTPPQPGVESPELVTGPTVVGPLEGDVEVEHLRARGFTVIPPPQVMSA